MANQAGQPFSATVGVESTGGTSASSTFLVAFYASSDTTIEPVDYFLGCVTVALSGTGVQTVTMSGTFPTNIPAGSYYVGWLIDWADTVIEDDESNNMIYKTSPKLTVVTQEYASTAARLYVDAAAHGAGNGSSWANAFPRLQDGLAAARQDSEIWVAQGVYTPDDGIGFVRGDRTASFALRNGLTVKGGYAGGGQPNPDTRDVDLYATILSGDLNHDDLPNIAASDLSVQSSRANNSRHVVTAVNVDGTAILDGVQIVGGHATASDAGAPQSDSQGAGLYVSGGSPRLYACVFSGNWAASDGGAVYAADGHLNLTGCTFRANAAGAQGGAVEEEKGDLSLANCVFTANWAGYGGGAIANTAGGSLNAVNCCIHANRATGLAGAIYNTSSAKASLWNCTIARNQQDTYAGTIVCGPLLESTPNELTIANCILWDGGDEIWSQGKSSITITRSDVRGGWAGDDNIDVDPLFDGDLRLSPGSPCIDAGDMALLPEDSTDLDADGDTREPLPVDLDGAKRVAGKSVDMGAYETQAAQ